MTLRLPRCCLVGGGGPAPVGKSFENHAPFLLCTDLDDTLVGDAQSLAEFNRLWKEELAPRGCKLVFNTGCSFIDYLAFRRDWDMLLQDAFIGGCGTQVYTFDAQGQEHPVRAWAEALQSSSRWDKQQVASQILCDARLKALYSTGHELREKSESEGNELLISLRLPATTTDVEQVRRDLLAALDGCNWEELRVDVASVAFKGATTVTDSGNTDSGNTSGADGCLFVDDMPLAAGKLRTRSCICTPHALCHVRGAVLLGKKIIDVRFLIGGYFACVSVIEITHGKKRTHIAFSVQIDTNVSINIAFKCSQQFDANGSDAIIVDVHYNNKTRNGEDT